MTRRDKIYKQILEQGISSHLAEGIASDIDKTIGKYEEIANSLKTPISIAENALERQRSFMEMIRNLNIPEKLDLSNFYPFGNEDIIIPQIDPVQNVRIVNPEYITGTKKKNEDGCIFFLEDGEIHHYQIGKLRYNLKGLDEPKYIKMFKNVIAYIPSQKYKIRISELEKNINKKDKCGTNYRVNIGKSAISFKNFLSKNGITNSHPEHKEPIISATDEYITFYNNI